MSTYVSGLAWQFDGEIVTARPANIVLDETHVFGRDSDTQAPLLATSGLEPEDFAVFIDYLIPKDDTLCDGEIVVEAEDDATDNSTSADEITEDESSQSDDDMQALSVGYFVTKLLDAHDGEGVLIAGDTLEASPREWMTEGLLEILLAMREKEYTLDDFGLEKLDSYVAQKAASRPSQQP